MKKLIIVVVLTCTLIVTAACGNPESTLPPNSDISSEITATQAPSDPVGVSEATTEAESGTEPSETDEYLTDHGSQPSSTTTSSRSGSGTSPKAGNVSTTTAVTSSAPATTTSAPKPPAATGSPPQTTTSAPKQHIRSCVYNTDLSAQVFNLVNSFRAENGVPALTYNATNAGYAKKQAEYNAVNDVSNKANHTVSQIGAWGSGVDMTGGPASIPNRAFNSWKNSAGHRVNMLDDYYTVGGAAVYEIRVDGVCEEYVVILDFDSKPGFKEVPEIAK